MTRALLVAAGGVLGALSRYYLQMWMLARTGAGIWPLFVVNISGAFAIGLILTLAERGRWITPELRLLLTTGFLGAYTTFSSWMWESVQWLEVGQIVRATTNIVGSVVAGVVAVAVGIALGRLL